MRVNVTWYQHQNFKTQNTISKLRTISEQQNCIKKQVPIKEVITKFWVTSALQEYRLMQEAKKTKHGVMWHLVHDLGGVRCWSKSPSTWFGWSWVDTTARAYWFPFQVPKTQCKRRPIKSLVGRHSSVHKKACSSLRVATTHAQIKSTDLCYTDSGRSVRCRCVEQQYDPFWQVYSTLTDKLVFF